MEGEGNLGRRVMDKLILPVGGELAQGSPWEKEKGGRLGSIGVKACIWGMHQEIFSQQTGRGEDLTWGVKRIENGNRQKRI